MPLSLRHYCRFLPVLLSILAGLLVLAAFEGRVMADETRTFVIPADDGYGVQDCLGKDQACAQVVASAWCEAHGLSAPLAYGRAEDMAGAIAGVQPAKLDPDAFVVTCKD
ncbi:MAG TPA: hypothetical protein VKV77_02845 [Methylovirgula sp.]|nr:hypothetical protein [Methylovirgula sp.]